MAKLRPAGFNGRVQDRDSTQALLTRISEGDDQARSELFSLLYTRLHRMARNHMRAEHAGHSLQPTALVNEAFLRLADGSWNDRKHFMLTASRAMRCVLIDHARSKTRAKRQGKRVEHPLDEIVKEFEERSFDLEALGEALRELGEHSPEMVRAVDLRFFAGMNVGDVAEVLGMSKRTFDRRFALTRAWLYRKLR